MRKLKSKLTVYTLLGGGCCPRSAGNYSSSKFWDVSNDSSVSAGSVVLGGSSPCERQTEGTWSHSRNLLCLLHPSFVQIFGGHSLGTCLTLPSAGLEDFWEFCQIADRLYFFFFLHYLSLNSGPTPRAPPPALFL
jgi:hypothetical protein